MGLRDRTQTPHRAQTPPAGNEFFGQLTGEDLVDADESPAASESPAVGSPPGGPLDPHAEHPLPPPEPPRARRCGRRTSRRDSARGRERPPADGARQRRLLAAGALMVGVLAVAMVVLGADQSGPPRTTTPGPRGAPNGTPASEQARMDAWFSQDGESVARERWRRDGETEISGRLTSGDGRPIAQATVIVLATDATRRHARDHRVGEVGTNRDGRFEAAIAVDEGAPRKRLTFRYLAHANDSQPAAEQRVSVAVYAPISLRADRARVARGQALRLQGRSAPRTRVTLLVRPPGSEGWQELADVRAGRDGGWRATVRAPRDASPGRWRFRARVAHSPQDGYLATDSRPVRVRVR